MGLVACILLPGLETRGTADSQWQWNGFTLHGNMQCGLKYAGSKGLRPRVVGAWRSGALGGSLIGSMGFRFCKPWGRWAPCQGLRSHVGFEKCLQPTIGCRCVLVARASPSEPSKSLPRRAYLFNTRPSTQELTRGICTYANAEYICTHIRIHACIYIYTYMCKHTCKYTQNNIAQISKYVPMQM